MLKKALNTLGVVVALVKACLCVIMPIESSRLKSLLNSLLKRLQRYIYVAALKPTLHPTAMVAIIVRNHNGY